LIANVIGVHDRYVVTKENANLDAAVDELIQKAKNLGITVTRELAVRKLEPFLGDLSRKGLP